MRILFVNPSIRETIFGRMKTLSLPPMGLVGIASATPPEHEVAIFDENVEEGPLGFDADLVAVTATTGQAPRAYELLEECRRRGIPSVIGGIHASVLPDEASRHADAVVVGEAEELWPIVVADCARGELKRRYVAARRPDIEHLPRARRELLSKRYVVASVQTSRGCPCNCSFCSVTSFNGRRYRFRSVAEVIEEIERVETPGLFLSDDSIVGLGPECVAHAHELFRRMKGLGKSWGSQVCLTVAEDDELLRAAAEAGAKTFYIGFESVDEASLRSVSKGVNLRPLIRDYREATRRIHDHGIGVIGGFILGTDGDGPDIFEKTIELVREAEIDGCQFTIMTPFPGTRLFDKVRDEGRLLYTDFPGDWGRYNAYEAVIRPKNMTVDELVRGRRHVYDQTSTLGRSLRRGWTTWRNTGSYQNAVINFFWNYYNYKAIRTAL
jgi:radical SAM superfamily enzyme YgiQ (UPF0313 family)